VTVAARAESGLSVSVHLHVEVIHGGCLESLCIPLYEGYVKSKCWPLIRECSRRWIPSKRRRGREEVAQRRHGLRPELWGGAIEYEISNSSTSSDDIAFTKGGLDGASSFGKRGR